MIIDIAANAFLLHMVRNLAAVLHEVGNSKLSRIDVEALLESHDRNLSPPTAHASGLYLAAVGYEQELGIDSSLRVPAILGDVQRLFRPVNLPCDYYRRPVSS